jgi:hypothetical protein
MIFDKYPDDFVQDILLICYHCCACWLLLPCLRLLFWNKGVLDVMVAASVKSEGLCMVDFYVQGISIAFVLDPLNESDCKYSLLPLMDDAQTLRECRSLYMCVSYVQYVPAICLILCLPKLRMHCPV